LELVGLRPQTPPGALLMDREEGKREGREREGKERG